MELQVIREDDDLTHLGIKGRMDIMGLEGVELKFTAHTVSRRKPTLIDLSGVEFIASLGLRLLISAAKGLKRHGAKMVLLNPQPSVENVLTASGFDEIMPISHNYDDAINILRIS
jgi:anti-sigma B factor antagonist